MKVKITVSCLELFLKLKAAGKVIKPSKIDVLHGYFLFEVSGSKLKVTGADGEGNITTAVDCEISSAEDCKFLIEHKTLLDGLKELPEQPVGLNVNILKESVKVELKHQSGVYDIAGLKADDFSLVKTPEESFKTISISGDSFIEGIRRVYQFAGNDDLRPIMQNVFIESKEGSRKIIFVATNSSIMAVHELESINPDIEKQSFDLILPVKIAKIVSELAAGYELIQLVVGNKTVSFTFDETEIIYRLFDGRYPHYNSVIPKGNDKIMFANTEELSSAIKRVSVFTNKASSLVTFNAENSILEIAGKDIDFKQGAEDRVSINYEKKEAVKIGFKSDFISLCVDSIETEEVQLTMSDSTRACLLFPVNEEISNVKLTILIMPMQINV